VVYRAEMNASHIKSEAQKQASLVINRAMYNVQQSRRQSKLPYSLKCEHGTRGKFDYSSFTLHLYFKNQKHYETLLYQPRVNVYRCWVSLIGQVRFAHGTAVLGTTGSMRAVCWAVSVMICE
jgi:hypothetical protein